MRKQSNFDTLLDRLDAAGVSFKNRPVRLHHQYHGDMRDTFLVYHEPRHATPLCTHVQWTLTDDKGRPRGGVEAGISRDMKTSLYRFVRGPLHLHFDDSSGYGALLMISDTPVEASYHRYLSLPALPTAADRRDDARLLADANSWYSSDQLENTRAALPSHQGAE